LYRLNKKKIRIKIKDSEIFENFILKKIIALIKEIKLIINK